MENTKKDINKANKKIRRCIGILQKDLPDICVSETPTKVGDIILVMLVR